MKNYEKFLVMDPALDQVAIAKSDILKGSALYIDGDRIQIKEIIKSGQRFALTDIEKGELVRQFGYAFGQSKGIMKGDPITAENIEDVLPKEDLKEFETPPPTHYSEELAAKTFMGYGRSDGSVGTRNYYLIVPTSMCASQTALQISDHFSSSAGFMHQGTGFDGVVAIPHTEGCGCDSGISIDRLIRILKNYIIHPNVGGCLIVDLGCEQTNYEKIRPYLDDIMNSHIKPIDWVSIEDSGGVEAARQKAVNIASKRMPDLLKARRESFSIEKLVVGTECGASDTFSGITANPLIGRVVDKIVYAKGSAILSEVPEMVGTLSMLMPRFRNKEVAVKFQEMMNWYSALAQRLDVMMASNLVMKNREGGLLNSTIKSLGAVMKGGSTVIEDAVDYGERIKKRGLTIMQGPGNDLESVTGIVASGATVVLFSTGQGTPTGSAICPVVKVASTSRIFRKLSSDMDFDAGKVVEGDCDVEALSRDLLGLVIDVASGKQTCSEKLGQKQFQIWTAGKLSL
jgi:altronate hydrolase